MLFGISAYLKVLGCFAVFSAVAGLGVAVWISRRPGIQRIFGSVEEPAMEHGRQPIAARPVWTLSATLMLGILIGYLLAQLLAIQVNAQALAQTKMLV